MRRLQVTLGIRDREHGVAEILALEDVTAKERIAASDVLFVTGGGNGLQNDDVVKLEEDHKSESAFLELSQTITLAQVKGGFDLMAIDNAGHRLFVAAQENNSLEVLDLEAGKLARSVPGMKQPKGVLYVPETNRLYIGNYADGSVRVLDGRSLEQLASIDVKEAANNVRYDAAGKLVYVGYGKTFGAIGVIDPATNSLIASIKLAAFPKQFAFEKSGPRMFVNVPTANHVAVIDRSTRTVVATWPVHEAKDNVPIALDEAHHRLFVGCDPGKFVVLDTHTGKSVASLAIAPEADGIAYDAERHRIYVSCGEGVVEVIEQADPDHYKVVHHQATASGAGTSLFVSETGRLYVAVPQKEKQRGQVRIYQAVP